jgi:hypothetical protein
MPDPPVPTLELVRGADQVVNPASGELLTLADASIDELVAARDALAVLWKQRNEAAAMVDHEIIGRTDAAVASGELTAYTFETGTFKVSVDTGHVREYDSNKLRAEMLRLLERGELELAPRAIERIFAVTQWRLDLRSWKNLRDNPMLQQRARNQLADLEQRFSSPKRRTVRLEPLARLRAIEGTAEEEAE